jgi:acyl-CoA synthetase (AMP-forming)/AMP-acid ligase II
VKTNFARVIAATARQYGDREALVNIERDRRYTFRELHLLTNRIANMMLSKLNLRRGDRYLLILDNDNMGLMHHWTIFKGEAAAAFTNFRDSFDEHAWQIDWIEPRVVFLEVALVDKYYDMLRSRGVEIVCMDPLPGEREGLHYFWDLLEGVSDALPQVENDTTEDILLYRFTGGTTGKGKCAEYTIDNWVGCRDSFYAMSDQVFMPETRALMFAPLSHAAGMMVLACFFRGACMVTQNVPDLKQWCRTVESEKITLSFLVPTLLYRLLDLEEARNHDLSSLQTIFYGAAPMSPDKLKLLRVRFGSIFLQAYAATESSQAVGILSKADHELGADEDTKRLTSAGRPGPGVEVMIADDDGNELPLGEMGELWLRTRGTIHGYYKNPEGTASEFANGFWKSGDLGYMDPEGYFYIVDRKKDMIISGGFNVYAIEVEAAINSHPAVTMSAVVGVPHEEWGEIVHAEVILKGEAQASPEELIAHVKGRIGSYKAPKSIVIVTELPLSVVGKVLRRTVREKYWKDRERRVS